MTFFLGLFLGAALAVVVLGFLATSAYQRGYHDADAGRLRWRAERAARQAAARA
jgi:hypothetical protein